MFMKMCAIYDGAAGVYLQPFCVRHVNEAKRMFRDSVNKKDTPLAASPEDFHLFLIAEYDDATGVVSPIVHEALGNGLEFQTK